MSREFEYKQRPATNEYRENWDRAFGPQSCSKPPAEHTPDAAGPLARTEVSGVPAYFLGLDSASGPDQTVTILRDAETDAVYACPVCGCKTYATYYVAKGTYPLAVCNGCGMVL
jgi:hypothetical protein